MTGRGELVRIGLRRPFYDHHGMTSDWWWMRKDLEE